MTDLAIVREALATRMPVLGICRGHQLINIARGPCTRTSSEIGHRDDHADGTPRSARVGRTPSARGSSARAAPATFTSATAVAASARPDAVASTARDGLIEAIEDAALPIRRWRPVARRAAGVGGCASSRVATVDRGHARTSV